MKCFDFILIFGDLGILCWLLVIFKVLVGGDDSLLIKVIGFFEVEGFWIVGIKDVVLGLLVGEGLLGKV